MNYCHKYVNVNVNSLHMSIRWIAAFIYKFTIGLLTVNTLFIWWMSHLYVGSVNSHTYMNLLNSCFDEQLLQWTAASMNSHFNEQPLWWTATLMNSCFDEQLLQWTAASMNSHFNEQPLWWTAASMNSRFNEQPLWRITASHNGNI